MTPNYSFIHRILFRCFPAKPFWPLISYYFLANMLVIIAGLTFQDFGFDSLENFLGFRDKLFYVQSPGILIAVQAGVLGVISIALALVTIIAPKNNESSIIGIYYYDSRAFEIVISSVTLLAILCLHVFVPVQVLTKWFNLKGEIPLLSFTPLIWLFLNLVGISHFIMTTLEFVDPSKRRMMRKRYTGNFREADDLRNPGLPCPDQILMELADKAASKIDHNDLVEFRIALEEMANYHRFLFFLIVDREQNGGSMGFAIGIHPQTKMRSHMEWVKKYNQLCMRATNRIPDESGFIKTLATVPKYLLDYQDPSGFPQYIINDILNLIPLMMRHMGKWAVTRSKLHGPHQENMDLNSSLPHMEAEGYRDTIMFVAEIWAELITDKPVSLYGSDFEKWQTCQNSWPFFWMHLCKTAEMLTFAILNNDEIATEYFQGSLIRWTEGAPSELKNNSFIPIRFLPSNIIEQNRIVAELQGKSLFSRLVFLPKQFYQNIIYNAHRDTIFVVSALLLSWLMKDKHSSGIYFEITIKLLNILNHGGGGVYKHDMSLYVLRSVINRSCDYMVQLRETMNSFNCDKEIPENIYFWDNPEPMTQIVKSSAVILAARKGLQKNEVEDFMKETGLKFCVSLLSQIATLVKNPSPELLHGLSIMDPECNPAETYNELHDRIAETTRIIESKL